ncbi:hypothetical protein MPH_09416 [Macrophomina phaseolina MS6]|uniref:Myb-like DNA-binding domain-containing protein n=1 Tax=Macrophomina phaseolina (strain MS6) TaxID=1126212 RepID=K2S945_MACPH|nr:hypothetical protein MPH_09416 [Macrophomina phaseolina MS6]
MSRLKQAVKAGKETGLDVRFLWSCIQNSDMKDIDFGAIGKELDLTSGAASKRWSRLKQALERGGTGATAPAKGADQAYKGSKKAAGGAGKKRKSSEDETDEEGGKPEVKKERRMSAAAIASKLKAEADDDSEPEHEASTEDAEAAVDADDEDTAVHDNKPATAKKKKPAPMKPATAGPKKSTTAIAVAERKTKSTPRRRPLTDKEVLAKLGDEEAANDELQKIAPGRRAYPKSHNLLETFQALRTPGKNGDGDEESPTHFGTLLSYPAPIDSAEPKHTTDDILAAISEEAMKMPSAAEERLKRDKQQAAQINDAAATAAQQQQFPAGEENQPNAAIAASGPSEDLQASPWYSVSPHWADQAGTSAYGSVSFFAEQGEPDPDEQYV